MKSKHSTVSFIYAASEFSADMFYLSGLFVPDPFLAIIVDDIKYAVVNKLEYRRVQKKSNFDQVILQETVLRKVAENLNISVRSVGPSDLMIYFARHFAAKKIRIPADFPAILYEKIHDAGFSVEIIKGPFFADDTNLLWK